MEPTSLKCVYSLALNTYRLFGGILSRNIVDAHPKGKGFLWVREVILKSQVHIFDVQLHTTTRKGSVCY